MMLTRGLDPSGLGTREGRAFLGAELAPEPGQRAVGRLPLVLVDRAGQEALELSALGRHAAADHLGDRARHHHGWALRVEHRMGALHGAFGAGLAEVLFRQARHDDRQLVRRQRVRVVQHRGDGQVLAADRPVDDDLQALDGGEAVDGAPIAAGAVVIEDQHQALLRPGTALTATRGGAGRRASCPAPRARCRTSVPRPRLRRTPAWHRTAASRRARR